MRSIVLAFALAAPLCAVAATPNYTHPLTVRHQQPKEELVSLTFVNFTTQEHEVRIGDRQYKVAVAKVLRIAVPVGAVVTEYTPENSRTDGKQLIEVAASDAGKNIFLK